jgi:hypothetical protein
MSDGWRRSQLLQVKYLNTIVEQDTGVRND